MTLFALKVTAADLQRGITDRDLGARLKNTFPARQKTEPRKRNLNIEKKRFNKQSSTNEGLKGD